MSKKPKEIMCGNVGADEFIDQYASSHGAKKVPCSECKATLWLSPSISVPVSPICEACTAKKYPQGVIGLVREGTMEQLRDMHRERAQRN